MQWKDDGSCNGHDTNIYFDLYENNESIRDSVDHLCQFCPQARTCFAEGISGKEWGVWGGVYLEEGEISREFNSHKTPEKWAKTWQALTIE